MRPDISADTYSNSAIISPSQTIDNLTLPIVTFRTIFSFSFLKAKSGVATSEDESENSKSHVRTGVKTAKSAVLFTIKSLFTLFSFFVTEL